MIKIYCQPYTKRREISAWYGKAYKGHFIYDQIRIKIPQGDDIFITPDEAADLIRALSAALHHWFVKSPETKHIIAAKNERQKNE